MTQDTIAAYHRSDTLPGCSGLGRAACAADVVFPGEPHDNPARNRTQIAGNGHARQDWSAPAAMALAALDASVFVRAG